MPWQSERSDRVIILRLWREPLYGRSGSWRGSVHDITSGERLVFSNVRDLVDVIGLMLSEERLTAEAVARKLDNESGTGLGP